MSRSRFRWRLSAAAAVIVAAVPLTLAGASASTPASSSAAKVAYADPAGILGGQPIHGISFQNTSVSPTVLIPDLPRLQALGVNFISVYITTYVDKVPRPTKVTRTAKTPTDQELTALTEAAHSYGIAVQFMPVIWSKGKYVWRGKFSPEPAYLVSFFNSYTRMITHYADLADSLGVEVFSVGSELVRLQEKGLLWRPLVANVRGRYHGIVTYMSSKPSWERMGWWGILDVIAISPYYTLTDKDNPSIAELVAAWKPAIASIKLLHDTFNKPILFDEIGYESILGAARSPATTHQHAAENTASMEPQARAYEALLRATKTVPWLRGIVWFKWDPISAIPAVLDKSYNPRDKTAECVIAKYWAPSTDTIATTVGEVPSACALARML